MLLLYFKLGLWESYYSTTNPEFQHNNFYARFDPQSIDEAEC